MIRNFVESHTLISARILNSDRLDTNYLTVLLLYLFITQTALYSINVLECVWTCPKTKPASGPHSLLYAAQISSVKPVSPK
jgi:hypothetical protein